MSLTTRTQAATREELATNLSLAGETPDEIATKIGLSEARVLAALDVAGARPEDVWLVRDYLDHVISEAGGTPRPYSSLSEQMRAAAENWFPLVDVDQAMREATR
ncbi:DUF2316 family protein [Frondihabitans cladoniiphilus]|uniref:DUF2316 family protein n=1 Tax=Frondihabitans cladoniiphilus TaxID=715785 RepID=A0ABP8W7P9_9MICO